MTKFTKDFKYTHDSKMKLTKIERTSQLLTLIEPALKTIRPFIGLAHFIIGYCNKC
jgi:hypothetical protein